MKFIQLKKSLAQNILPCYIISGDDYFLCNSSVELIEKQLFGSLMRTNINKQIFDTENLDITKFITALNTLPFMAQKKLVVLKEYDGKNSTETISQLKQYLKSPSSSTVLVIWTINTSSFFKPLFSLAEPVDCNRLDKNILCSWITQKLKDYNMDCSISQDAIDTLVDYCNFYLTKINSELDKLVWYTNGKIQKEHVEQLVQKDLEYSIFELTDSLAKGDNKKAQMIKNDLMSNKKTSASVFPLLVSYFRRLFYALVSNGSNLEIANNLGVKEYAVTKAKEQAKKFGAKKLKDVVELCAELDYKTKTSLVSVENAVDYILLKVMI